MIEDRIEGATRRREEAESKLDRPDGSRCYFADVADPLRGRADELDRKAESLLGEHRGGGVPS